MLKYLNKKNKGYGSALKEGLKNIKTEYFCIINADGSMDPKYLREMLLLCEKKDFIFASRYLKGGLVMMMISLHLLATNVFL